MDRLSRKQIIELELRQLRKLLAVDPQLSITDIMERMGVNKSTVYNRLKRLKELDE